MSPFLLSHSALLALTPLLASVLHNIGIILFGPPAFTLLDTDRPP